MLPTNVANHMSILALDEINMDGPILAIFERPERLWMVFVTVPTC